MSSLSVFRSNRPEVVGVLFDVKISEEHDLKATPTLFPIEGTAEDIVEHIILNPRIVTVETYMSNIDDDNKAIGENAKKAIIDLDALRVSRGVLDLLTDHVAYENMVITSIVAGTPGSGPTDKYSMAYSLTFQQIILLATNTVLVPSVQLNDAEGTSKGQPVNKSASSEIDAGIKSATVFTR